MLSMGMLAAVVLPMLVGELCEDVWMQSLIAFFKNESVRKCSKKLRG